MSSSTDRDPSFRDCTFMSEPVFKNPFYKVNSPTNLST